MFSRVRDRFGTAGLVVAIVALVAALGGSAYAASNALNGKQKKEVEKIAKKYAGVPGANGAAGTPGAAGGAPGPKGDAGAKGNDGTDGASVVIGNSAPGCGAPGGKTIEVENTPATKQNVCNGLTGYSEVLPSGKTETGAWAASFDGATGALVALPFTIPLEAPLDGTHVVGHAANYNGEDETGAEHETCPGSSENPQAKAGYLCVYSSNTTASKIEIIFDPAKFYETAGAATSGAGMYVSSEFGPAIASGTWAVTAP